MAAVHLLPLIELTAFSARQTSLGAKDAYPLPDFLHALLDQQLFRHSHEILTQLGNIRSIPQLATLPGIINTLIHQPPPSGDHGRKVSLGWSFFSSPFSV